MNSSSPILASELSSKKRNSSNRKRFFANPLHREIFFIVLGAALIPMTITAVGLFYLIFNITAEELGIPEAIAYNIIPAAQKVTSILIFVTPPVILAILFMAHKISHQIVGPFDRIIRELDLRLDQKRRESAEPIRLRPGDKFQPLVDKINELFKK